MGALTEIVYREENPPALLFEGIPGYPKGYGALSGRDQFSAGACSQARIPGALPLPGRGQGIARSDEDA
jgi:hypothetical protein